MKVRDALLIGVGGLLVIAGMFLNSFQSFVFSGDNDLQIDVTNEEDRFDLISGVYREFANLDRFVDPKDGRETKTVFRINKVTGETHFHFQSSYWKYLNEDDKYDATREWVIENKWVRINEENDEPLIRDKEIDYEITG